MLSCVLHASMLGKSQHLHGCENTCHLKHQHSTWRDAEAPFDDFCRSKLVDLAGNLCCHSGGAMLDGGLAC